MFFGVSFGLFLLYLSLKIRIDFPENLRSEVDRFRRVYGSIEKKGRITPKDLVIEFERMGRKDPAFHHRLDQCKEELTRGPTENSKHLSGITIIISFLI